MASLALFFHQSSDITQSTNKSYGIDTTDVNKFRVNSIFNVTGLVQAYAMVSGTILLQQQAGVPAKVNLILKPHNQDNLKLPIKYIVYRGLQTSDFIDNNNLSDPNNKVKTSGSELVDAMQAIQQQRAPADDVSIESLFGNELAPPNTKNIDEFFFKNLATNSQLFTIEYGIGLGNFATGEVSIEVILENPEYTLNVEDAKKVIHEINVTGLANAEKKWKQDLVRHFVDPAAYYGLHHDIKGGIEYRNASGKQYANTPALVYSQIVDKFLTKNRVYLDVRNENGYSYNYYDNYVGTGVDANKNIKVGQTATTLVAKEYYTNGWAIHIVDVTAGSDTENEIFVALRINDNTKPLLAGWNIEIIPYTKVDPANSAFQANRIYYVDDTILLSLPSGGFTSPFSFKVPNISGGTSAQLSAIIKLDYNKQQDTSGFRTLDGAGTGTTDYNFGTANLNLPWDTGESVLWHTDNFKKFVESAEDIGFSGYIETGHILDANSDNPQNENVLLYAAPENYFLADGVEKKISFNKKGGSADLESFTNLFTDVSLERTNLSLSTSEDILSLSFSFDNTLKRAVQLLGMTKTEWDTTVNNAALTLSNNHIKLIKLTASGTPKTDLNGTDYNDFEIAVTGMNSSGTMQEVGTGLTVYTTDHLIFSTKAFSENYKVDYTEAENNLNEFYKETLGVKVNPNDPNEQAGSGNGIILDKLNVSNEERANLEKDRFWTNYGIGKSNKDLFSKDPSFKDKITEFKTALDSAADDYSVVKTLIESKGAAILEYGKISVKQLNKDGILYLARLIMLVVLKNHPKVLTKFPSKVTELSDTFEKHSRGLEGTEKPNFTTQQSSTHFNILISGFDPFGSAFPGSYYDWQDHQSNPSGNLALALDGEILHSDNIPGIGVKTATIKSVIFPVRFKEFDANINDKNEGWIEEFFKPFISDNNIKMIITFSYGVDGKVYNFEIERFAARNRGLGTPDNNKVGAPSSSYLNAPGKENYEFIETTLPYNDMFMLNKVGLDQKAIFDYYQDSLFESTSYINNSATNTIDRDKNPFTNPEAINVYNADLKPSYYNNIPSINIGNYDPVDVGVVANKIKSQQGSGGNYLSNEIYYRVAYLRKELSQSKFTGHIHVGYLKKGNMSVDRTEMLNTIKESLKQALNNFQL